MHIADLIRHVQEDRAVTDFLFSDESAYLSHVFKMFDDANKDEWQLGYYSSSGNQVHVFLYDERLGTVIKNPGEEAFKEPDAVVPALELESLKVDDDEAMRAAEAEAKKRFGEGPGTRILLLQQIPGMGTVYNFTFLTPSFKSVNIKLDAGDGKVLSANRFSLFDMGKQEK